MTRISSLFVATTLAILPISAFAQQDAAPVKAAAPASTTPATNADKAVAGKTEAATVSANPTQAAKPAVKSGLAHSKTEMHGMNAVKSHDGKTNVPMAGKTAEPAKS